MLQKSLNEKAQLKPKSILESLEHIVELAENSTLSAEFFAKADVYIKYASRKLKLSPVQTVLLSIFVDHSDDSRFRISEIAEYVGCRTTKILRMANEIDVLEARHYIRGSHGNKTVTYRVPEAVIKALRNNQPYVYVEEEITSVHDFFYRFGILVRDKNNNEILHDQLIDRTVDLLRRIPDTEFSRELRGMCLEDEDLLLFLQMANLYVRDNDNNIGFHDLECIYDDHEVPSWCQHELRSRTSALFEKKLIENVNDQGMARCDVFRLTTYAKDDILAELNLQRTANLTKGLIKTDTLMEKTLYYNPAEHAQVAQLQSLLSTNRFTDVQRRLRDANMRSGFCCIFYGAPGTGKTETVYQLARSTGRDILRVDVDKIKSCWVGESEKNLKELFDRYRAMCKRNPVVPILLFNEADALLGVRLEGATGAVDKMENSLQNIILQEMESLEGIMIATTNLTTNLDSAFERRFVYKVRFEKPSVDARASIWQTMLRGLSANQAQALAMQFDLSGGEIENIARKHSVNAILTGQEGINMDAIIDTCRHERLSRGRTSRIGF